MKNVVNLNPISKDDIPDFVYKNISLNENELVVKIIRKHWVVFRNSFLLAFFVPFVLIFFALFFSSSQFNLPSFFSKYLSILFIYVSPVFFLIGFFTFLKVLYLWYKTFYIVTNQRLIKIEQETLFESKIHQIYFDKVQDAICKISGLEAILYGYGDISIQGSSETAQIELTMIATPKKIQQIIAEQTGKVSHQVKL